jgi:hypothetical protein
MTHAMIIVLRDPASGTVRKTIVRQYNPGTLTRSLQPQVMK